MAPRPRTVVYVEDDELNRELMAHIVALVRDARLVTAVSLGDARAVLHGLRAGEVDGDVALLLVDLEIGRAHV